MINEGVNGVEFIAANTDAQAFGRNQLALGKQCFQSWREARGSEAAQAHIEDIRASLDWRTYGVYHCWYGWQRAPARHRLLRKLHAKWVF